MVRKMNVPAVPTELDDDEAAMEHAWRVSGDLHIIANRLGLGLLRGEIPPALTWMHKALLDLANARMDTRLYAKEARSLVRYVAVREAHDSEGLSWEDAKDRAVEMLQGQPAAANRDWMWAEYCKVRKALRDVGAVRDDDDPGYRQIDVPDKS